MSANIRGAKIPSIPENLILKYGFGMENSVLDLHLNTQSNLVYTPHGYLSVFKKDIIREINPIIKRNFATSAKISFFFDLKMQKLHEDGSHKFDDSEISNIPLHINPQDKNVTEDVMDCVIDKIHQNYINREIEGSGWSLNRINRCVAIIVASHKSGIPTGHISVGTWSSLPKGMRGLIL